jgi:hypothetical protein
MTIRAQLDLLVAGLAAFASQFGADVQAVASDEDVQAKIENGGSGLLVFVGFRGEVCTHKDALTVQRNFRVAIARPYGWAGRRETNLVAGGDGKPAMFDLIESARDALLLVEFGEQEEWEPRYVGADPVPMEEQEWDLWTLDIEAGTQLDGNTAADS